MGGIWFVNRTPRPLKLSQIINSALEINFAQVSLETKYYNPVPPSVFSITPKFFTPLNFSPGGPDTCSTKLHPLFSISKLPFGFVFTRYVMHICWWNKNGNFCTHLLLPFSQSIREKRIKKTNNNNNNIWVQKFSFLILATFLFSYLNPPYFQ